MYLHVILFTSFLVVGLCTEYSTEKFCSKYCRPGDECWPSIGEIANAFSTLNGYTVSPYSARGNYAKLMLMKNAYVTKFPYLIIYVGSTMDVQKVLMFAKEKKMRVSIQSSGHDYIGRSTGDDTLQINLSNMKDVTVKLDSSRSPAGEITVQSGNTWHRVYREVDAVNRVVVGGSAQTVAMGGYNLGGGHSPMSRKLGLAVDNLLEVEMVTVDGKLVTVNEDGTHTRDAHGNVVTVKDDLFWALRGGGGGTFGVVISFTLKLHYAPDGFVGFTKFYAMVLADKTNIAEAALNEVGNAIKRAPDEWSGYVTISATPTPGVEHMQGLISVLLLHFGGWSSPSREYMEVLDTTPETNPVYWQNYTSFMDYKGNNTDEAGIRGTLANTLVQESNLDGFSSFMASKAYGLSKKALFMCTCTCLGGKTKETRDPDVTSVNPALRTAVYSASCGSAWENILDDSEILDVTTKFNTQLQNYGTGVYLNEPAAYQMDWRRAFWGNLDRYNRLLDVKRKYDPSNFLTCQYCVGSNVVGDVTDSAITLNSPTCLTILPLFLVVFAVQWIVLK